MRQFTSDELRKTWKQFYIDRGHVDVGAVSLVSDGSTGVMFNVAGMQPLMPYLLGQKHPLGTRLCNVQGCVRTNDIDSVGDKSHVTFFEMMGSWSLGDYFKKERCQWSFELLTQVFGFDADHLAATVFAGDENAPRDEEGAQYRIASGFKKENIYYLPAEDNWWGLEYGPCGPDSEMFYVADRPDCGPDCGPGCHCGKYTELGNDVFMQYEKHHDGHLTPLKQKNVDTGWGLERILAFLNGTRDVYRVDLFAPVIAYIEKVSGTKYEEDEKLTRSMRILADHIRTSVMLIGDEAKLLPSNVGAGYVLRRLIRRAVRHGRMLNLKTEDLLTIAQMYIDDIYAESYPLLVKNKEFVLSELKKEIDRFESTLENGMKEFKKILEQKKEEKSVEIDGKSAFYLYDTFGFPLELTVELAQEEGLKVDEEGFARAMEEQKQKARDNQSFSARLSTDTALYDELSRFASCSKYLDGSREAVNDMPGFRDGILARLGETYLIAAEALIRQHEYDDALYYINEIRKRAAYKKGEDRSAYCDGGAAYNSNSLGYASMGDVNSYMAENSYYESNGVSETTDATNLIVTDIQNLPAEDKAIIDKLNYTDDYDRMMCFLLNERSRELCGEFLRWEDLARTKTLVARAKAFNPDAASNVDEHHCLRPIPQTYLDAIQKDGHALTSEEKKAEQNPGY